MLAQHGWKSRPSPRRGFTVVEAARELKETPVVAAVHDSAQALRLFRSALDEAMSRSCDLVVLDYGSTSLRDELKGDASQVDPSETSAMRALWTNPHVHVVRVEPADADLEKTVSYCESVKASLLIIGADHISAPGIEADLANRIFNGDFDVLVITDHPTEDRLLRESGDGQ
jgi:hypothetical protein